MFRRSNHPEHMNPTPAIHRPIRTRRAFLTTTRLAGLSAVAALSCLPASTYYWTGTGGNWTTSTSALDWATTSTGSPSTYWTNANAADIVTSNAQIHLWNVSATTVTIENGAAFYASGSGATSTTRGLTITQGGSGDFSLTDQRTSGTSLNLKVLLTGSTAWNGTITVNGSSVSTVSLTIASQTGTGANSVGVNTKVHLASGGNLEIGPGVIGTVATIGELSGNGNIKFPGQFSSTGGTRTLRVEQSTNTTFSGTIGENLTRTDHVLAFTKAGTGVLSISGTGGYEGATTVEGGKLYLNGTYGTGFTGVTGQGDYVVKNGALLGVNGSIALSTGSTARNVTIESGGTLKPGTADAAGTMTISGGNASSKGLVFLGQATIEFRLGTAQDLITLTSSSMTGSALGGDGSVVFDLLGSSGAAIGSTYDLISFGGTAQGIALGTFALSSASQSAGWAGTFSYGGDGNLLQFTVSAVPEPGAFALAVMGLMGAAMVIRRRAKSAQLC